MKTNLIFVPLLVGLIAFPAFAQDELRVLQFVRFESEADYQKYSEWIADMENIRFSINANGKRWTSDVEAWAKEYVQNPAKVESNDGIFLITYAEGGLDKNMAQTMLQTLSGAYNERLVRRAKREEELLRQELEMAIAKVNRESASAGQDEESLREELREITDRLLKAKLQAAQAEARSRALMEYERKQFADAPGQTTESEVNNLRRELATREFEGAKARLARARQLSKSGRGSSLEVDDAEIAMGKAELELAELREEEGRKGIRSLDPDLRAMLIDAEAERASALAVDAALREHEAQLRAMIERQSQFEAQKSALGKKMRKLDGNQTRTRARSGTFVSGTPRIIYPEW